MICHSHFHPHSDGQVAQTISNFRQHPIFTNNGKSRIPYNIYAGTAPWSKHFLLNAIMYAFVNIIRLIAKTTFAYSLGMYTLYIYKLMEDNNRYQTNFNLYFLSLEQISSRGKFLPTKPQWTRFQYPKKT